MKTGNLSLATVVLSALAVSYSACGAQGQDNSVPGAPTGPDGQAGSVGLAGSVGVPMAGNSSSGTPGQPSAGAPGHFGGAPSTGAGGAKPNGGSPSTGKAGAPGTAGAASGVAGAPPTTGGCTPAAGAITELLIDDLEDGNDAITPTGARVGYWYTYNDGTTGAAQIPAPTMPFKGTAPGSTATPKFAATTSGTNKFILWGAGMGFDFHNVAAKSCPYNASAYAGIKFWAKSNLAALSLKSMIKIPATTPTTSAGGKCAATATAKCEDHFSVKSTLTTAWAEYKMPFATIAQEGFGGAVTFDKTSLLAVQFQVPMAVAFDFSIDDVSFY